MSSTSETPKQMASCDQPPSQDYWANAVSTLIGKAILLLENGERDHPEWMFELATNIACTHLDGAHVQRIQEIKLTHQPQGKEVRSA